MSEWKSKKEKKREEDEHEKKKDRVFMRLTTPRALEWRSAHGADIFIFLIFFFFFVFLLFLLHHGPFISPSSFWFDFFWLWFFFFLFCLPSFTLPIALSLPRLSCFSLSFYHMFSHIYILKNLRNFWRSFWFEKLFSFVKYKNSINKKEMICLYN